MELLHFADPASSPVKIEEVDLGWLAFDGKRRIDDHDFAIAGGGGRLVAAWPRKDEHIWLHVYDFNPPVPRKRAVRGH